jgi:hypothetical protein
MRLFHYSEDWSRKMTPDDPPYIAASEWWSAGLGTAADQRHGGRPRDPARLLGMTGRFIGGRIPANIPDDRRQKIAGSGQPHLHRR